MSSTSSSGASNGQPLNESWWGFIGPYVVPPVAASVAIVPAFRDMIIKSAQQKGMPIPCLSFGTSMKEGLRAAPTVGAIVGTQMVIQGVIEKVLSGESKAKSLSSTLASSAIVGTASAPILAVFNGQTMGWTVRQSIQRFSVRQSVAIAIQETAFVGGLSIADQLSEAMKKSLGNNKTVDYTAAFVAGAIGSLTGHPANTALTRWQSRMPVDNFYQLMRGSMRKAKAVGIFSVVYKLGKEILNSTLPTS